MVTISPRTHVDEHVDKKGRDDGLSKSDTVYSR